MILQHCLNLPYPRILRDSPEVVELHSGTDPPLKLVVELG